MKLSQHSKIRIKQRTDLKPNQYEDFFRNALRKGKSIENIKDNNIKEWLIKHIPNKNRGQIKIYRDYVFIYGKNSHRLYTMYKLPEELLESEVN